MTILPALALALPTSAGRGLGKPNCFRCRLVNGRCTGCDSGGGDAAGEGTEERELDDAGDAADKKGVSRSASSMSTVTSVSGVDVGGITGRLSVWDRCDAGFARFAAPCCDSSEEAEDSSKVLLGER